MKHYLRWQSFIIPQKLVCEVKATLDESIIRRSQLNTGIATNITCLPIISFVMMHKTDTGWARMYNDHYVGLTRYQFPLFIEALTELSHEMKTVELYSYTNDRLEINPELEQKFTHVLTLNAISHIEIKPVLLIQTIDDNEQRMEGISIKFNTNDAIQYLTLNEFTSLLWNVNHIDIDNIMLMMIACFNNQQYDERLQVR